MRTTAYQVSTKALCAQGRQMVRALQAEGTRARREALSSVGIDAAELTNKIVAATEQLESLEAEQERAKEAYLQEAREDRAIVEEGYRYKLSLDARARAYIAAHGDEDNLPGRLRFGHLTRARARGVIYELRAVLPELPALTDKLASVGIDDAFIAKGWDILARLQADKQETEEAKQARMRLTKAVRAGELALSQLLHQLDAADEAITLETPAEGRVFRLEIVEAERARMVAAQKMAEAPLDVPVLDED